MIFLSPGVYPREIDLSQIVKLSGASTGCMVFGSNKGPTTPQFIASDKQFIETYGKPDPKVSLAHYSALPFLREGGSAWFLRVVNGATYPTLEYDTTAGTFTASATASPEAHVFSGLTKAFIVYPIGPGTYGHGYRVSLISAKPVLLPDSATAYDSTKSGVGAVFETTIDSTGKITAVAITSGGTGYAATGKMRVTSNNGTGAVITYASTAGVIDAVTIVNGGTNYNTFTLNVYDASNLNSALESWPVSLQKQLDGYGRQMYLEDVINVQSALIRVYDNAAATTDPTISVTTPVAFSTATDGTLPGDSQLTQGWETFVDTDTYTVNILINGGYATANVHNKMESVAVRRGDAFAILDMPSASQTVTRAMDYRKVELNMNSSYAGIYAPDIKVYDEFNDLQLYVPPSGEVAAVFCRTDTTRDPWWAAAGLNRGLVKGALGLRFKYLQGERDQLYSNQINFIQNFPGEGIAVFGQRTLQAKASALQSINVRRLLLVLEKAAASYLKYSLFEPSDSFTWTQIRLALTEFLQNVKDRRGLYDFQVVCDETNNTPYLIDNNILKVDIYLKPTRAAEFIDLAMVLTRSGASFQELINSGAAT